MTKHPYGVYVFIFLVILIIIIFTCKYYFYKPLEINIPSAPQGTYSTEQNNLEATEVNHTDDLVPGTNYTCKELLPRVLRFRYNHANERPMFVGGETKLVNNESLSGEDCLYNSAIGEKASIFKCSASYSVFKKTDENFIIINKEYTVYYNFENDAVNCKEITSGIIECPKEKYSCYWRWNS